MFMPNSCSIRCLSSLSVSLLIWPTRPLSLRGMFIMQPASYLSRITWAPAMDEDVPDMYSAVCIELNNYSTTFSTSNGSCDISFLLSTTTGVATANPTRKDADMIVVETIVFRSGGTAFTTRTNLNTTLMDLECFIVAWSKAFQPASESTKTIRLCRCTSHGISGRVAYL